VEGSRELNAGTRLSTAKFMVLLVPPPGLGLLTVTLCVPATVWFPAGIVMVTSVGETRVVVSTVPSRFTVEEVLKPVPKIASRVFADPTVTEFGAMV
jgi:hypothetical protein